MGIFIFIGAITLLAIIVVVVAAVASVTAAVAGEVEDSDEE